jgi:hypothetical protein
MWVPAHPPSKGPAAKSAAAAKTRRDHPRLSLDININFIPNSARLLPQDAESAPAHCHLGSAKSLTVQAIEASFMGQYDKSKVATLPPAPPEVGKTCGFRGMIHLAAIIVKDQLSPAMPCPCEAGMAFRGDHTEAFT